MKRLVTFLLLYPLYSYSQLSSVGLVKDIYAGTRTSYPVAALKLNNTTTLFFAEDEFYGWELWKSDGTPSGTTIVKDISVGTSSCIIYDPSPDSGERPIVHNGIYYFFADDGIHGFEVWRSDGTELGTYPLTNSTYFAISAYPSFTIFNGFVYFWATDNNGYEVLYKTGGTLNSTTVVRTFYCGGIRYQGPYLSQMIVYNNLLYFISADELPSCNVYSSLNSAFWRTDGTPAGTMKAFGSFNNTIQQIGVANNAIYFTVRNDGIYKSNGTENGTTRIRQVGSNFQISTSAGTIKIIEANSLAYFISYGGKLWRTDGTLQGTFSITSTSILGDESFIKYNADLFFVGRTPSSAWQLMKADGTISGTQIITNIPNGGIDSKLCVLDNYIHLIHPYRPSIWRTDGSSQNVVKIVETVTNNDQINIEPLNSGNGLNLIKLNNKILFIGDEAYNSYPRPIKYGREIRYITDNGICSEQISTKSGNWNDPTIWSCGTVPNSNQNVTLKAGHNILLTNSMGVQKCKNLIVETGAIFQNNGNFFLAQP